MNLKEATEIVCKNRPELARVIRENTTTSVLEYYQKTMMAEKDSNSPLIDIISDIAIERGLVVDGSIIRNTLQTTFRAGTADHHGPLGHPFFFHNTLIEDIITPETQAIIILPCAGISLDNSSFPRGVLFHTMDGTLVRIPFFPSSQHRSPVYGMKIHTENMKQHAEKQLTKYAAMLSPETNKKLQMIINNIFQRKEITTYEIAISHINKELWKLLGQEKKPLITIDQESVVVKYICSQFDKNQAIRALLTDTSVQESFIEYFDGVIGAFDSKKNTGTHLFWYRNDHTRERMHLQDGALMSETGVRIALTKDYLIDALTTKKIYPSMALSFIVLCGMEGLRTDGGFSQINYLKKILEQYQKLQKKHSDMFSANTQNIDPSIFRGEITIAPFRINAKTVQATLLDLLLYAPKDYLYRIKTYSEHIPLTESIYGMMESFYKITTGHTSTISDAPISKPLWYANETTTE